MMGTSSPYPGMARSMYGPFDPRLTCAGRYSGFGQRWPYMYGMLEVRGDVLRVLNHPPISPKAELSRRRRSGRPSRMARLTGFSCPFEDPDPLPFAHMYMS